MLSSVGLAGGQGPAGWSLAPAGCSRRRRCAVGPCSGARGQPFCLPLTYVLCQPSVQRATSHAPAGQRGRGTAPLHQRVFGQGAKEERSAEASLLGGPAQGPGPAGGESTDLQLASHEISHHKVPLGAAAAATTLGLCGTVHSTTALLASSGRQQRYAFPAMLCKLLQITSSVQ